MEKTKKDVYMFIFLVLGLTLVAFIPTQVAREDNFTSIFTLLMSIIPLLSAVLIEKNFKIKDVMKDKLSGIYFIYFIILSLVMIFSIQHERILKNAIYFIIVVNYLISMYIISIITSNKILMGSFKIKYLARWFFTLLILKNLELILVNYYYFHLVNIKKIIIADIEIITIGILFIISTIFYTVGEEYGWRKFLQPRLQSIFGKRIGVLITGLIWGIWHLPLYGFNYYYGDERIYAGIHIIFFCILFGVFLGLIYMKYNNILIVSVLHSLNNIFMSNMSDLNTSISDGFKVTMELLIITTIIGMAIFLPFLFCKEYSKSYK